MLRRPSPSASCSDDVAPSRSGRSEARKGVRVGGAFVGLVASIVLVVGLVAEHVTRIGADVSLGVVLSPDSAWHPARVRADGSVGLPLGLLDTRDGGVAPRVSDARKWLRKQRATGAPWQSCPPALDDAVRPGDIVGLKGDGPSVRPAVIVEASERYVFLIDATRVVAYPRAAFQQRWDGGRCPRPRRDAGPSSGS